MIFGPNVEIGKGLVEKEGEVKLYLLTCSQDEICKL